MASEYTAQEMREYADAIAGDLNDNGHSRVTYTFDDLLPVIQSLRYAADVVERCNDVNHDIVRDISSMNGYTLNMDAKDFVAKLNYIISGDAGKEDR